MRLKRSSASELRAEQIIRRTLLDSDWVLSRGPAVSTVFEKDRYLAPDEYSLYSQGSFDFVVQHADQDQAEFVIEFDGPLHERPEQAARDIIKNRLCHEAQLPLIRIGFDELRERDEISVLEWLIQRFVVWEESTPDAAEEVLEQIESAPGSEAIAEELRDNPEEVIGILAATYSSEFPFPANAEAAIRLYRRFGISLGEPMEGYEPNAMAPYLLDVVWPGTHRLVETTATTYNVCERQATVRVRAAPTSNAFTTIGSARFAFRHRIGRGPKDFSAPELPSTLR